MIITIGIIIDNDKNNESHNNHDEWRPHAKPFPAPLSATSGPEAAGSLLIKTAFLQLPGPGLRPENEI